MEPSREDLSEPTLFSIVTFAVYNIPLPTDTPQGRLKQIGLMTTIGCLHQAREPVTLSALTKLTGLSRASVTEIIGQLFARGFLTEALGKNSLGRGTVWQFSTLSLRGANRRRLRFNGTVSSPDAAPSRSSVLQEPATSRNGCAVLH